MAGFQGTQEFLFVSRAGGLRKGPAEFRQSVGIAAA
jgi:hypothetical protein